MIDKDVIKRILNKSSKRNYVNSMTTSGQVFERLWRPHNTRREIKIFPFEKKVKRTILKSKGFIVDTTIPYKMSSHTGIIDVYFSNNLHVQVKRETVLGIWQQTIISGEKETVLLSGDSRKEVLDKIDFHNSKIKSLIEDVVLFVVKKLGLHTLGDFYKDRGEEWTRSKHYIDKLPKDCIVHEDDWNKVYAVGAEVVTKKHTPEEVDIFKQFISNEMVLDFAPLIAEEIAFNRLLAYDIKAWCDKYINSLVDFNIYKDMIVNLSFKQREDITDWVFERFGGVK